ncbi:MAG TPA: 3-dehydroquinate synthase [Candidatus Dormibacteraeota bacterium]|nr:3-dehydroquinate synthase [Candidatus Dormibacteraeota bacterium]
MNNVVLVGFMGSGKSTVGPHLAHRLERPFVDLDDVIEAEAGRSVAEIFSSEGEAGFRERESRCLQRALERDGSVVAVGGGAPMRDENWARIRSGNTVVALLAEPGELARRLDGSSDRPLLEPGAPSVIASLLPARLSRYLEADVVVKTDGIDPVDVAEQVGDRLPGGRPQRILIDIPGSPHDVTVGHGLCRLVPAALRKHNPSPSGGDAPSENPSPVYGGGQGGGVLIVTDEHVAELHARPLVEALSSDGITAHMHLVPAGEAAKELGVLASIYEALAAAGVDRQGALIALGGGTVGDVTGFAAATWMRGIRYLQLPTTLLAMVDSSIGGKTAINLPAGKNLVGSVHQPSAIFCDLDYLATLSDAEYRASLAEVIKAALIADRLFVDWLVANLPAVLRREPPAVREAVVRAIAIKAAVVAQDPQETGLRAILNYGHTVGHALERAAGFGRLRHGEAVAWGMEVAARISLRTGACGPETVAVQHSLLRAAGLLADRPAVAHAELMEAMRHDKKSRAGKLRWVLLREIGRAEYGQSVDPSVVESSLAEVLPA